MSIDNDNIEICDECGFSIQACRCDDLGDGPEEDEDHIFDCHMDRSGNCGKAGSEECEFECPYRRIS